MSDPVPPAALHFDPAETGQAALGWIVEDRWLRQALLAAVAETGGVTHVAPETATAVAYGPADVRVATESSEDLLGRLVIACDGRRSETARSAGIRYLSWSYGQTGLVSAIEHELAHHGEAHQSFFAGGPFAVLPLTGNRSSLVWSERNDRARVVTGLSDDAYLAEIAARIGSRLGRIGLAGRRWSYPLGLSLAMSYARPRLVVAGDAAHGVHPIAGQGLNMGLRDVAALTEVLVGAARLGEDLGALTVLERYERWRRPDASAMALGMDGINRLFSTASGPLQGLRNLGLDLVAHFGPARRFFMRAASGAGQSAPRLLLGQPI